MLIKGEEGAGGGRGRIVRDRGIGKKEDEEVEVGKIRENSKWVALRTKIQLV